MKAAHVLRSDLIEVDETLAGIIVRGVQPVRPLPGGGVKLGLCPLKTRKRFINTSPGIKIETELKFDRNPFCGSRQMNGMKCPPA
jgi:hypothetical protein